MEFTLLAARLLLAAIFLFAGLAKLLDPAGSRKAFRDFGLPRRLSVKMVLLLPLAEFAVAVALIPAGLAWYGAWGALGLLGVFMIAVAVAMIRGRAPDCHCFGQVHSAPVGWRTLVRNTVLGACAAWLVSRGPGQTGGSIWARFAGLFDDYPRLTSIAAAIAALVFLRLLSRSRPKRKAAEPETSEDSPLLPFFADDEEASPEPAPAPVEKAGSQADSQPVSEHFPPPAREPVPEPAPARTARDIGLPVGTPAPEFELPLITGEKRSLQSFLGQGRDVLLIFSSPHCKSCEAMAKNLVRWMHEMQGLPNIVLVSRGSPQENFVKLKEFGATQVLLQKGLEVAELYDCSSTPSAVLIGADGVIRTELVQGAAGIRQLLASHAQRTNAQPANAHSADTKASQRASALFQ